MRHDDTHIHHLNILGNNNIYLYMRKCVLFLAASKVLVFAFEADWCCDAFVPEPERPAPALEPEHGLPVAVNVSVSVTVSVPASLVFDRVYLRGGSPERDSRWNQEIWYIYGKRIEKIFHSAE